MLATQPSSTPRFRDRRRAGHALAVQLGHLPSTMRVYGIVPGGIVVAAEVARELDAPLDVWLVRELGDPEHPERWAGAFAEGACLLTRGEGGPSELVAFVHAEASAIRRAARRYRSGRWPADVRDRAVVLVDDAVATDLPLRAAITGARKRGAASVTVATPIAHPLAAARLRDHADQVITLVETSDFDSVWYEDDRRIDDDEIVALLADARRRRPVR